MRIFKTKTVSRFLRKERIDDARLIEAVEAIERGLVDADLGGGLVKQRVARTGQGKSGGYRVLIGFDRNIARSFIRVRQERTGEYRRRSVDDAAGDRGDVASGRRHEVGARDFGWNFIRGDECRRNRKLTRD